VRHDRPPVRSRNHRLLRGRVGVRALLRAAGRRAVSLEYAVGLAASVLLAVYLVYALIKPERF